jgi:hypothetical protein
MKDFATFTGGTRKGWGKIYLYFGCRNSDMDDIYKNELKQMKNEGVLTEVNTALSREPDTPKVKCSLDVFLDMTMPLCLVLRI